VSSDEGTSLGAGGGAGTSSNVRVGRSTVSKLAIPADCGFMSRSMSMLISDLDVLLKVRTRQSKKLLVSSFIS
jgi:hypothetical protein